MNPAVGIRPATAGDLDAVECVERRSFPKGEAFTRRQLRYLLTHAQGASYAATRDGAVVGYISLLMRRTAQTSASTPWRWTPRRAAAEPDRRCWTPLSRWPGGSDCVK